MSLLIDTNRYRDFAEGVPEVVQAFQIAERLTVPFVTLAELRAGFRAGKLAMRNEQTLVRFLNKPRVTTLFADTDTTHHYAALFAQLRQQGTPIPTNDIWIAALALQHDLLLYTRDQHYAALPQLPRWH